MAISFRSRCWRALLSTRRYQAIGEIQVQKESADALGLDNMMGGAEGASDALDASITLQTQANLLQSDTLALKVIEDLGLERTADFRAAERPAGLGAGILSPEGSAEAKEAIARAVAAATDTSAEDFRFAFDGQGRLRDAADRDTVSQRRSEAGGRGSERVDEGAGRVHLSDPLHGDQ